MEKEIVLEITSCMYIIGGKNECFIFPNDGIVKICKSSIDDISILICNETGFVRINIHVIVNTKYFVKLNERREIVMKGGIIFKVSRRSISLFKYDNKNVCSYDKGDEYPPLATQSNI